MSKRPCPNPLFVKWVEEWRDEAIEKGRQSHFGYSRALKSLKKCPLPLRDGTEAKQVLEAWGDKLEKMVNSRLEKYLKETGQKQLAHSALETVDSSSLRIPPPTDPGPISGNQAGKKKGKKRKAVESCNGTDEPQLEGVYSNPKKVRKGSTREYVPERNSGPYAILLTLLRAEQSPTYVGFMRKADLQRRAQPLATKSFTVPDPGSHYTAWSSSSTLISKGLMKREGNPGKYTLTEAGRVLAERLEAAETGPSPTAVLLQELRHQNIPAKRSIETALPQLESLGVASRRAQQAPSDNFMLRQRQSASQSTCVSPEADLVDLSSNCSPEAPAGRAVSAVVVLSDSGESTTDIDSEVEELQTLFSNVHDPKLKPKSTSAPSQCPLQAKGRKYSEKHGNDCDSFQTKGVPTQSFSTAVKRPVPEAAAVTPPEIILRPGQYEIVLLCDIAERKDGYSGQIVEALLRNGVKLERRKLHIGDYLWIAQEITQPLPGQLQQPRGRELVLDYIVERKRMDDLAMSIVGSKDRYHDQKHRIGQSGLQHPIYLVEDYVITASKNMCEERLLQAMATTQIHHGFFVKRTQTAKESAAYLTLLTRQLQRMYSQLVVQSCMKDDLLKRSSDLSSCHTQLLIFDEFNQSAVKNKAMSISDLFAKQLMQLPGVSAHKAAAILQRFASPRLLIEAYSALSSKEQKESLLASLPCGTTKRRLGPKLSTMIYQLYGKSGPLV